MIYYTLLEPSGSMTDTTDYVLYALTRYGSNGDAYPAPEMIIGGPPASEDEAYSRVMWDADLADGFDSDLVAVSLDADLQAGTATWASDGEGAEPVNYSFLADDQTVGSVRIVAGAQVPGTVVWNNLTITFYDDGVAQETCSVSGGPSVDTRNSPSGIGEQVMVVTPDSTLYDRVAVAGTFRMSAGPDTYPAPSDLFGQIVIVPRVA